MRRFILFMLLTLLGGRAVAQRYPERREVRKGNRRFEKGDFTGAAERYRHALELLPGSYEAAFDLGNALYRSDRFDESVETLRAAAADSLQASDVRSEAFYNLGNAQFRQRKYQEALESYKNALRLNPADEAAKFNYAYTKLKLDRNGGDDDSDQNQNQNQNQNQDQNQDQDQNRNSDGDGGNGADEQQPPQDGSDPNDSGNERNEGSGASRPSGISPEEQERMLDAIQAQEDKTQEKLKEKAGVVVRLKKNW